jgi:hypothetical protein
MERGAAEVAGLVRSHPETPDESLVKKPSHFAVGFLFWSFVVIKKVKLLNSP